MTNRRGVTLTELLIAVLIGSVLSLAITRLFTSGIRITQKGTSHLTNIQNAAILMAQIEKDLERAEKMLSLETPKAGEAKAHLEIISPEGRLSVLYQPTGDRYGYRRDQSLIDGPGTGETISHLFCQGLLAHVSMQKSMIGEVTGVSIEIRVKSGTGSGEEETLKRFVFCPNLISNRRITTFDWKY